MFSDPPSLPLLQCLRYKDDGENNTGQASGGDRDENDDKPKVDEHKVEHLDNNESYHPVPGVTKTSNGFLGE